MDREELVGYDSLARLRIKNFQSIRNLDIGFGRFTVLVGPSSSGKSAILRAIRTLVRNTHSSSYVSYGQGSFEIEAAFGDTTVKLERGKGKSVYEMDGVSYPKAGIGVPRDIDLVFRFPTLSGFEVSLADQFDRPFLLGESGASAAKVLGELTNASLLLIASSEANRRRLGFSRVAKLREQDVRAVQERLKHAAELKAEQQRLIRARDLMREAQDLAGRVQVLSQQVSIADIAAKAAHQVREQAEQVPNVREELTHAEHLLQAIQAMRGILEQIAESETQAEVLRAGAVGCHVMALDLRDVEREMLREMGVCPVCHQSTKGLE